VQAAVKNLQVNTYTYLRTTSNTVYFKTEHKKFSVIAKKAFPQIVRDMKGTGIACTVIINATSYESTAAHGNAYEGKKKLIVLLYKWQEITLCFQRCCLLHYPFTEKNLTTFTYTSEIGDNLLNHQSHLFY